MPYDPQVWVDDTGVGDGTELDAAHFNHMEDGIDDAHVIADAASAAAAAAAAASVPKSVVDAKGDLIVGTAADTVARRAVGANDEVLAADSGQSTGVIWKKVGNAMVADDAAIALSKLAGYPNDATKFARGDGSWAVPPSDSRGVFAARRTTDQSIGNGTTTKVQFSTDDYDQDGWYDAGNFRYLPTLAGYYLLMASITMTDSWNDTTASLRLYKNGTLERILWAGNHMVNNDLTTYEGSAIVFADGDDYFEVFFKNDDSAGHNVQGRFEGFLLKAT